MQILMQLIGALVLIFLVVKGLQQLFPTKKEAEETTTQQPEKDDEQSN